MINPRNSHTPLPDDRRKRCPICRQTVYSSAGIHPQCAIKQADPWLPASATPVPVKPEQQPEAVEIEGGRRSTRAGGEVESEAGRPSDTSSRPDATDRRPTSASIRL